MTNHESIHFPEYLFSLVYVLRAGAKQPFTLALTPMDNLVLKRSPILECGRKLEYPDKTHASMKRK